MRKFQTSRIFLDVSFTLSEIFIFFSEIFPPFQPHFTSPLHYSHNSSNLSCSFMAFPPPELSVISCKTFIIHLLWLSSSTTFFVQFLLPVLMPKLGISFPWPSLQLAHLLMAQTECCCEYMPVSGTWWNVTEPGRAWNSRDKLSELSERHVVFADCGMQRAWCRGGQSRSSIIWPYLPQFFSFFLHHTFSLKFPKLTVLFYSLKSSPRQLLMSEICFPSHLST